MDMEMEEWTAFRRRMVGRYDRISRLGDEWELSLCQLTVLISHHAQPRSDIHIFTQDSK
jgi:hypothetical protein